MLYDVALALQAELRSRSCPYDVAYGLELVNAPGALVAPRIVLAPEGEDEILPSPSRPVNPPMPLAAGESAAVRIYAKVNRSGAMYREHERESRNVRGLVVVSLLKIAAEYPTQLRFRGGKLLTALDLQARLNLDAPPQMPGAVYELRFQIDRAIKDAEYSEVTIGGVGGVTIVTTDEVLHASHPEGAVPETAC